jgi:hypothetical protein
MASKDPVVRSIENKKYREANKERIAVWQKKYREANKEFIRERKRAYREANKKPIAEKKSAYAKKEDSRLADKARGERYRAAHPERVREIRQRASAKRAPVAKIEARQKRVELQDSYVAQILRLPTSVASPEIIEAERMRLKIKREIQELDKHRTEKKCSSCKAYKPIISFSRYWKSKDGHSYECFICGRERKRKDRELKGSTYTPRKVDDFGRRRKHTTEELKASRAAYYLANIETIRAKDRARHKQRKEYEPHQPTNSAII